MRLTTCGNLCDICQAYARNYRKHDERLALSAAWKKYVGLDLNPKKIHCAGGHCCAAALGFKHDDCPYKPCASRHGVAHCGFCAEFPCAEFDRGHKMSERDMRDKLGRAFDLDEYEKFIKVFDNQTWVAKFRRAELSKKLAVCGFRCDLCQAFASNIRKEDRRGEVSRVWKKYYGLNVPAEKILCDGCRATKRGAKRIDTECPVRACVMEKGIGHCGECDAYPCPMFEERRGLSRARARRKLGRDFISPFSRNDSEDNISHAPRGLSIKK